MNPALDKRQFITDLIDSIKADILKKVDELPEDWDGHELRRYIADKFVDNTGGYLATGRVRENGMSKRLRDYRHAVIINNL